MDQDWIFDVLADLRAFANANRFTRLPDALDKAIAAARADLADRAGHSILPRPVDPGSPQTG